MAVSNLTALIARDEYVLEESYSGEEEADDDAEEVIHWLLQLEITFDNLKADYEDDLVTAECWLMRISLTRNFAVCESARW